MMGNAPNVEQQFDSFFGNGNKAAWSTPYYGLQHLNAPHDSRIWATVDDRVSFAECKIYTPGCGLRPQKTRHANADEARAHGERELARMAAAAR